MFLAVFLIGASSTFAQVVNRDFNYSYYEAGKSYEFRSLDPKNPDRAFVLTVRFDEQGRAYISQKVEKAQANDKTRAQAFFASGDLRLSTSTDSPVSMQVLKNQSQYFVVSFAGADVIARGVNNSLEIVCTCTFGSGSCSPAGMIVGNVATVECIVEPECSKCEISFGDKIQQPFLLLRATEVIFE